MTEEGEEAYSGGGRGRKGGVARGRGVGRGRLPSSASLFSEDDLDSMSECGDSGGESHSWEEEEEGYDENACDGVGEEMTPNGRKITIQEGLEIVIIDSVFSQMRTVVGPAVVILADSDQYFRKADTHDTSALHDFPNLDQTGIYSYSSSYGSTMGPEESSVISYDIPTTFANNDTSYGISCNLDGFSSGIINTSPTYDISFLLHPQVSKPQEAVPQQLKPASCQPNTAARNNENRRQRREK